MAKNKTLKFVAINDSNVGDLIYIYLTSGQLATAVLSCPEGHREEQLVDCQTVVDLLSALVITHILGIIVPVTVE